MAVMKDRLEIARNWLPRYTGMPLDQFGDYVLLTNFQTIWNDSPRISTATSAAKAGRCRRPPTVPG